MIMIYWYIYKYKIKNNIHFLFYSLIYLFFIYFSDNVKIDFYE